MIGIIITGHGNFASGLLSTIKLIVGVQSNTIGVDFLENDSVESLREKLLQAKEQLINCDGILFLTDIAGGSPFKASALLSHEIKNSAVIAGTNVGMLIEACLSKDIMNINELKKTVLEAGNNSIKEYELINKRKTNSNGI